MVLHGLENRDDEVLIQERFATGKDEKLHGIGEFAE